MSVITTPRFFDFGKPAQEPATQAVLATIPETEKAEAQPLEVEYGQFADIASFKVTDNDSYAEAGNKLVALKGTKKKVETFYDAIVEKFRGPWKAATAKRKSMLDPLDSGISHLAGEMGAWDRKVAAEAAEARRLAEEAQRKADEARRKAEEEAAANCLPWDVPEVPVVQAPVIPVPTVQAPPQVDGLTKRNLPWKAKVVDMKALVKWSLENNNFDYLLPNEKMLNVKAGQLGEMLKEAIPGVEAYRGTTYAAA